MPMYTFNVCRPDGLTVSFEAFELPTDADTFAKAGQVLDEHQSCDHVEVWDGDRGVLARHREQPVIRPVEPCDQLARAAMMLGPRLRLRLPAE